MYKIIHQGKIIDIVDNLRFFRYTSTGWKKTRLSTAHAIRGSHSDYFILEGAKCPQEGLKVSFAEMTDEEYESVKDFVSENIPVWVAELNDVRKQKADKLRSSCNEAITNGVDVLLQNGTIEHFDLTVEDQLNLSLIRDKIRTTVKDAFIYHSANSVCKSYNRTDMLAICDAAANHVHYHTTYFNLLKYCIYNMNDKNKINNVNYGDSLIELGLPKELSYMLTE